MMSSLSLSLISPHPLFFCRISSTSSNIDGRFRILRVPDHCCNHLSAMAVDRSMRVRVPICVLCCSCLYIKREQINRIYSLQSWWNPCFSFLSLPTHMPFWTHKCCPRSPGPLLGRYYRVCTSHICHSTSHTRTSFAWWGCEEYTMK